MKRQIVGRTVIYAIPLVFSSAACGSGDGIGGATSGTGAATGSGATAAVGAGGTGGGIGSGTGGTGGAGAAGNTGVGGAAAGVGATGGAATGAGGMGAAGSGGTASTGAGAGGSGGTVGGLGGAGGGTIGPYELDCGPQGVAIESAGPPENRVNYIIVGDGYTADEVDTTFIDHVMATLDRRFNHESGEPYGRYRKFVNICAMKSVSTGAIGTSGAIFGGRTTGDRTAAIDEPAVNQWLDQNLPMNLEPDWIAASLNISSWSNVGGGIMLFAGGNEESAGGALHEGGHSFHQLADEYGTCTGGGCGEDTNGTGPSGQEYGEINSTGNPATTAGKWDRWMGAVQVSLKDPSTGATGVQSTFSGSRHESPDSGQYRPSDNSMMNSLFGLNVNTSFNAISREQIIYTIWREVRPIDETDPPAGAVNGATTLQVLVIDPEVINVDWSVDGAVVAENGGTSFNLADSGLAAGAHTISATAYDNASEDLVRYREGECPQGVTQRYCHSPSWLNSIETVEWTVTLP